MASIQKYKTPNGVVRYRVMWRDENKQRSKSFDRWKNANDYKTKLEHDQRSGVYVEPVHMTLKSYLSEWISIHESGLAYNTAQSYRKNIRVHINPHLGNIELQKLNSGHIEVFLKILVKEGVVRTAQISYNILSISLKAAVRKKYIPITPCDVISKPKYIPKRVSKSLQPDEINQYISIFEDTWCYIAVILGVTTGMRRGELAALRWKDINYAKREISINGSIYMDGVRKRKAPKSNKPRTVFMSDSLMYLLKQQRKRQKINQIKFGQEYKQSDYVVTEDDGTLPSPPYIYRFFKRQLKKFNLPHIRLHDLRHTSGSIKLFEGADIQTVSDDLGHHSAAFTAKTYLHTIEEAKKKAANSMDKYLKNS